MKKIKTYFVAGLVVIVPVALTFFLIFWLVRVVNGILGNVINVFLSDLFGIASTNITVKVILFLAIILLIIFMGMFARNYFGRKLIQLGEWILSTIPIVNRIYHAIQQIAAVFITEKREAFRKAVLFEYPRKGVYSIGFVTRDTGGEVQDKLEKDMVSLFLPTTPNPTSGYLLFVPKEDIIELDMPIEESLKLIISGGAVLPDKINNIDKKDKLLPNSHYNKT